MGRKPKTKRVPIAAKWDSELQKMIPYIWKEVEIGKESSSPVGKTTKKEGTRRKSSKE